MLGFIIGFIVGIILALRLATFTKEDFMKLPDPIKKWVIEKVTNGK